MPIWYSAMVIMISGIGLWLRNRGERRGDAGTECVGDIFLLVAPCAWVAWWLLVWALA